MWDFSGGAAGGMSTCFATGNGSYSETTCMCIVYAYVLWPGETCLKFFDIFRYTGFPGQKCVSIWLYLRKARLESSLHKTVYCSVLLAGKLNLGMHVYMFTVLQDLKCILYVMSMHND